MGVEDEDFVHSDDDFDDKQHEKLLDKILTINKTQQLKKASRTEPALQISEFDLAKSITGKKGVIHVGDLTNILQKKKAHVAIKKKVDHTSKITSTLPKPLEKPLANQINRTVAYEKTRLELDRWEPIITANRVSTDLLFPLPVRENYKNVDLTKKWTLKNAFDIELEKKHPELVQEIHVDTQPEKVKLTLAELKERRGKLAEYRAKLSYQEAKARRQNKIKSKKYHRIQKKAKIKQQLKEFEELKKTKPEEALKRLEEIERIRAQERFSLRHKSTGKWAKHKQIHAKYDKESRAELAQQLQLSKELTQKVNTNSDSEDDNFTMLEDDGSKNTILWSDDKLESQPEVTNFINDYAKFYVKKAAESEQNETEDKNEENIDEVIDTKETENSTVEPNISEEEVEESHNIQEEKPQNKTTAKEVTASEEPAKKKKKLRKRRKTSLNVSSTSDWDVELMDDNIDVIFDELEKKMDIKLGKEASKIKKQMAPQKSSKKRQNTEENHEEKESLLALPIEKKRPRLDEPLLETSNRDEIPEGELSDLNNILKKKNLNIDQNQVMQKAEKKKSSNSEKKEQKKVTHLDSILPDFITNMDEDDDDDNDDDEIQRQLKEEAADCFENDLEQQFAKEKAETIEKDKPKDVSFFLPGWGSWGGVGIVPSKRKRRRFVVKAPKKVSRRDDNKGFLIINEKGDEKMKEHMVDELPFPFQRVEDFEQSIKAPIGRTFVPENAFRRLIKPAVKTKIGTIIEPMDKDVLLQKSNV